MNLEPYYATDRRVYNGAPCTDMQKQWNHEDKLLKKLKKLAPNATCCYFPMEGKYMTFNNFRQITDVFHSCKQLAIIEAINYLTEKQNEQKL